MAINLTDSLNAATTKGKLGDAKQIYLNGDAKNLQQTYEETSTHFDTLDNRSTQMEESIKNISVTGGASVAEAVTYDNTVSGLESVNVKGAIDEVSSIVTYDVSARNDGVVFESLQALLGSSNLDTLIPVLFRHGGMTIRFIQGSKQSSDNKYVQYFLTKDEWNIDPNDWEKMNLEEEVSQLGKQINGDDVQITDYTRTTGNIRPNGTIGTDSTQWYSSLIPVTRGNLIKIKSSYQGQDAAIAFTTSQTPDTYQVLLLASQKIQENNKWVGQAEVPSNGYISICYLTGDPNGIEIVIHSTGVTQEIEIINRDVETNKEDIAELSDYNTIIDDYTKVNGYGIRIDGSVETSSLLWYSSPIPVKFGDTIILKSKYLGAGAAIVQTDANSSYFNPLVAWESNEIIDNYHYITYTVEFNGYIIVTYLTKDNDISVTKKNAQTYGQAERGAKTLGGNTYSFKIPDSSAQLVGEIRVDGTTNTDQAYWHSYPKIIKAGDILKIKSRYTGAGTAIALTNAHGDIYTPLVLWSSAIVIGDYKYITYKFKEDGLVSYSYVSGDNDITVTVTSSTNERSVLQSQDYTDKNEILNELRIKDIAKQKEKIVTDSLEQSENNSERAIAVFRNETIKSEVHNLSDSDILTHGICGYYDDGNGNITDGTITWKLYKNGILYISGYGKFYDFIKGIFACNTAQDVISLTNNMSSDFWYYGFIEPNANGFENPQRPPSGYTYDTSEVMVYQTKRFLPQSLGDSINPLNNKPYGYAAPWYIYRVETDIDNYPIENARVQNIARYKAANPNGWTYNRICIDEDFEHGGITYIGDWTFYRLSSEYLVLPVNVTKIGCWGVRYSDTLKYVVIENNVTEIEDHGISRNIAMKHLNLPASIVSLGYECLSSNTALKRVTIKGHVSLGTRMFNSCLSLVSVDISNIAGSVPEQMCSVCYFLAEIKLPNTAYINKYAFYRTSLFSVVIPENVKECDADAFAECDNLKDVTIDSPRICQNISDTDFGRLIYHAEILRIKTGLNISNYIMRTYKFVGNYDEHDIYIKIKR